jgi:hypothetical protein
VKVALGCFEVKVALGCFEQDSTTLSVIFRHLRLQQSHPPIASVYLKTCL